MIALILECSFEELLRRKTEKTYTGSFSERAERIDGERKWRMMRRRRCGCWRADVSVSSVMPRIVQSKEALEALFDSIPSLPGLPLCPPRGQKAHKGYLIHVMVK